MQGTTPLPHFELPARECLANKSPSTRDVLYQLIRRIGSLPPRTSEQLGIAL